MALCTVFNNRLNGAYHEMDAVGRHVVRRLQDLGHDSSDQFDILPDKPGIVTIGGQETSLGRFLRRRLPKSTISDVFRTDSVYEAFVIEFTRHLWPEPPKFHLTSKIEESYKADFGGQSCMSGKFARTMQWLECNDVKLLKLTMPKKQGRALIWKTRCGETLLDRIYCGSDQAIIAHFQEEAIRRGWLFRESNGCSIGNKFIANNVDAALRGPFAVDMRFDAPNGRYPYLDSFSYGKFKPENGVAWRLYSESRTKIDAMFNSCRTGYECRNDHSNPGKACYACECWHFDTATEFTEYNGSRYCNTCLPQHVSATVSSD